MYFGKLMSKSVNVFSRKGNSGNSTNAVTITNTVISKYSTNILIFSLLFVIFSLEQRVSAQNYKHLEMPVALISKVAESPNNPEVNIEEAKLGTVTRPRFVNPRVTPIESKIEPKTEAKLESNVESKFYFPLKGLISSSYGENRRTHRHKGIDIAAPTGTPFYAAAPGTVIFAGWQSGYGNTLIISHDDGRMSRYAHAQKLLVACGDRVGINEPIAKIGSTGRSTGPHLHFELMDNSGREINPLRVLYKRDFSSSEPSEASVVETLASSIERED